MSKYIVSNYGYDMTWLLGYGDNYLVYDRSDTDEPVKNLDPQKVIKVPNIGWDIYDKLTYIIDNYDNLPPIVTLIKGNLWKYISKEEFNQVKDNKTFTPLLTKSYKTAMPVCFYSEDGLYNEFNDRWFLGVKEGERVKEYDKFWESIEPGYQNEEYKRFAPGASYILPRENILQHPKAFYEKLRTFVDYAAQPAEIWLIERDMYHIFQLKELRPKQRQLRNKFIRKGIRGIRRLKRIINGIYRLRGATSP